jgi:hypothetical protein
MSSIIKADGRRRGNENPGWGGDGEIGRPADQDRFMVS